MVAPAANATLAGTVATAVLLDERFTLIPLDGAGPDRVNVRLEVFVPVIVRDVGLNEMDPVT